MDRKIGPTKAKTLRVEVLKQFKAPDGNGVTMVYPGDVVDLDQYTASILIGAERAKETTKDLHIDREGGPKRAATAARERAVSQDPASVLARAVEAIQKTLEQIAAGGGLFAKK